MLLSLIYHFEVMTSDTLPFCRDDIEINKYIHLKIIRKGKVITSELVFHKEAFYLLLKNIKLYILFF